MNGQKKAEVDVNQVLINWFNDSLLAHDDYLSIVFTRGVVTHPYAYPDANELVVMIAVDTRPSYRSSKEGILNYARAIAKTNDDVFRQFDAEGALNFCVNDKLVSPYGKLHLTDKGNIVLNALRQFARENAELLKNFKTLAPEEAQKLVEKELDKLNDANRRMVEKLAEDKNQRRNIETDQLNALNELLRSESDAEVTTSEKRLFCKYAKVRDINESNSAIEILKFAKEKGAVTEMQILEQFPEISDEFAYRIMRALFESGHM